MTNLAAIIPFCILLEVTPTIIVTHWVILVLFTGMELLAQTMELVLAIVVPVINPISNVSTFYDANSTPLKNWDFDSILLAIYSRGQL